MLVSPVPRAIVCRGNSCEKRLSLGDICFRRGNTGVLTLTTVKRLVALVVSPLLFDRESMQRQMRTKSK
jgi:hypothetical protein